MATKVFCLVLLCLHNVMASFESISHAVLRSGEVLEQYVIHDEAGEAKSHLFSQCMADANTIEGVLYSITVPGDEEYVRFVPKEKMEFQWTMVDIGDGKGTVGCAQKAHELSAYMFKFDGSCSVALDFAYDPESEQACDGAATEVVYITSRPLPIVDGQFVPVGESSGCYYHSPEGMRYNVNGPLVSEVELPPAATCCNTADQGFCLIKDCSTDKMSFCEAQARCKAIGVQMSTLSFYADSSGASYNAEAFPSITKYDAWTNLKKIDGVWRWLPDMAELSASDFKNPVTDEDCGYYFIFEDDNERDLMATSCNNTLECVYCFDPDSTLPQC